jgi:predicted nucleotidyltransferase
MEINSDYKNLLKNLNAAGVRYLVVGAYAVMVHTEPRFTKDLDVWIDPEIANAHAVFRALAEFGAPLQGITAADFAQPEVFYQLGVSPVRVDILTSLSGIEFAAAWERRVNVDFDGEPAAVLGREDLIAAKRAAGRPQDKLDIRTLRTPRMSRKPSK